MADQTSSDQKKSRNSRRGLIVIVATLIALVFLGVILYGERQSFIDALQSASWREFALLALLQIVTFILIGLSLKVFAAEFDIRLGVIEWFGLTIVTSFTNLVMPLSSGLIARGGYLKQRYQLSVSLFASITAGFYIIAYALISLMVLAILILRSLAGDTVVWPVLWGMAALAAGLISLLFLPLDGLIAFLGRHRWTAVGARMLSGWQRIRSNPMLVISQGVLAVAIQLMQALAFWLALTVLNVPASLIDSILVTSLSGLAIVFRVTPGSLGISEGLSGLGYALIGGDGAIGISASVLVRLATLPVLVVLGPIFMRVLAQKLMETTPDEA